MARVKNFRRQTQKPKHPAQPSEEAEQRPYRDVLNDYNIAIAFRNSGIILFFLNFLVLIWELLSDRGLFWFWWILPFSITCITSGHFLTVSVAKSNKRLNEELLYQKQCDDNAFEIQKKMLAEFGTNTLIIIGGIITVGGLLCLLYAAIPWGSMIGWIEKKNASSRLTKTMSLTKSDQAHIQTSINELQRLATALEIGTTYRDFSQTLNDVAPNVQIALDKIEGENLGTSGAKNSIQICVARYVKIRSVWDEMIQNYYYDVSSGEGKTFYELILFEMTMAGDYDDTRGKFIDHVLRNNNRWKTEGHDYLFWYGNYRFYKIKNDFKETTK